MRHAPLFVLIALAALTAVAQQTVQPQPAVAQQAAQPQPATPSLTSAKAETHSEQAAKKGCLAVKPIGSHAFRNIMLLGVAGAIISKQQYQVVDVKDYPARIGEKFHGGDLQTLSSSTNVVVLDKHPSQEELQRACE